MKKLKPKKVTFVVYDYFHRLHYLQWMLPVTRDLVGHYVTSTETLDAEFAACIEHYGEHLGVERKVDGTYDLAHHETLIADNDCNIVLVEAKEFANKNPLTLGTPELDKQFNEVFS